MSSELSELKPMLLSKSKEDQDVAARIMIRKGFYDEIKYEVENPLEMEEKYCLKTYQQIQNKWPMTKIAGSVSLFLHGVRLRRYHIPPEWGDGKETDDCYELDVISPYYIRIPDVLKGNEIDKQGIYGTGDIDITTQEIVVKRQFGPPGEKIIKVDLIIDPKAKHEVIRYNGYDYNVGRLEDLLAAKLKYIQKGGSKHLNDIYDMVGKTGWKKHLENSKT